MSDIQKRAFFLSEATPYLNQVHPEYRNHLSTFYLCYADCASYAVRFKFTDKWEVDTCVKWMR